MFYKGLKNINSYTPSTNFEKEIPNFSANLFEKETQISSNEIFKDDKYYLLNVWSSWCVPCREEHIVLLNLSKNNNLNIIGLNYKDKKKNAKKFLSELDNPYSTIISDKDGTLAIEWGAFGVPESFLIYKKKILKKFVGPLNQESELEIRKFIK
tara:strand:+ start:412 stop:873 length:462 start_codon:yes stop_codon:yes gene_type:complete